MLLLLAVSLASRFSLLLEHAGLFRPFLYHRRSKAAAREYLFTFLFSHCPVMLLPLPFENLPSGPSTHKVDPLQLPTESKGKDPLLSIYLCNLHFSDFMSEKVSSILPLASLSSCTQSLKYHCPSPLLYKTGFSFLFILRRILPQ